MRAFAISLILAWAPALADPFDGGLASVYSVCPEIGDAGAATEDDAGTWYLPAPRGPRLACQLAGCEEYVRGLEPGPQVAPVTIVAAGVALVVGVVAGAVLWWQYGPKR